MKKTKTICVVLVALLALISTAYGVDNRLRAFAGETLNVLVKTGYESAAILEFKDSFTEATGIKLNIEVVDEPTLRRKFVMDAMAGTGAYDVVAVQFWYMPEYLRGGFLEPLNDFIRHKATHWLAVDDIPDGLLQSFRGPDGTLFAIPVSASGGVLMYRKDLFEEFGIPVPRTTQDVLNAARTLKANLPPGIVPFVGRGDASSASFGSSAGWAWGYGASIFDAQGNIAVTSEKMKQAMTDWVTLMRYYGPQDAAAMSWATMSEIFRMGKAAMNFDMSGFPAVYMNPDLSQVADKVGVTTIVGPAGNALQWLYSEGLGIPKASPRKDAAWLFIQWRTSLEVAIKEVQAGLRTDFPLQAIYYTDEYKEATKDNEFARYLPTVMASIDPTHWPFVPQFTEVAHVFQSAISLAIAGTIDVETALQKAEVGLRDVLR